MYTCRWGYCATVCPDVAELDQHIFEHINSAQPIQLKGIKRRKIGTDTWVTLPSSDSQDSEAEVRSQIFQPVSNELPIHESQAGNTSINTDTTYPIPSFPSFHLSPSVPSQPAASQVIGEQSPANTQEESSQQQLSPARTRIANGKKRSASPFIPPTQAILTQLSSPQRAQGHSQSPSQAHATQSSQASSVELGRANPSPLRPSPPDSCMPPPSLPTAAMPHTPRESLVRKESMSRLLAFGSAAGQSPKAGQSPIGVKKEKETEVVAGSVFRSRLSVGFTFGQKPSR